MQWRSWGVCCPGRMSILPPLEIFVSNPKNLLATFLFLSPIYYSLVCLPNIFYPSKYCFPFQIFRYNLNFVAPIAPPPFATPLILCGLFDMISFYFILQKLPIDNF